jgi:hypothetical protein
MLSVTPWLPGEKHPQRECIARRSRRPRKGDFWGWWPENSIGYIVGSRRETGRRFVVFFVPAFCLSRTEATLFAPKPPRSQKDPATKKISVPSVTSVRCFPHWACFSHRSRRVHRRTQPPRRFPPLCDLFAMLSTLGLFLAPNPPRPPINFSGFS